jgi:hypothetical protein
MLANRPDILLQITEDGDAMKSQEGLSQLLSSHNCPVLGEKHRFNTLQRLIRNLCLVVVLVMAGLANPQSVTPVEAGTLSVISTSDNGVGSLRQMISDAAEGDTITFNLPTPATIVLSSPLNIDKDIQIDGLGVDSLALDGGGAVNIFKVTAGTLRISQMTLQNGKMIGGDGSYNIAGGIDGFGGAVYVGSGSAFTALYVNFNNNWALGGNGGNSGQRGYSYYGGGGGGLLGGGQSGTGGFGGGGGGGWSMSNGAGGGFGGGGGGSAISGSLGGAGGTYANMVANGDPNLLKIVYENLLNNAYKFTGQREQAHIQVGMEKQAGEWVYYVCDNGTGFNMAFAHKLFAPFQRLHSKDEFPGTGIGLVTVKRIITRHGGRIWPEAVIGQGATFYFTLGEDRQISEY